VGSIPGVLLGSQMSIKVPERALRIAFAFVLVLSGVKLVKVPGSTAIIEVGIGIGLVTFVVWGILQLRVRRLAPAE
jgi:hypothetical protein